MAKQLYEKCNSTNLEEICRKMPVIVANKMCATLNPNYARTTEKHKADMYKVRNI